MKLRGNAYFLMLILALILVLSASALTAEALSSKLMPLIIGTATAVLVANELIKELRGGKRPGGDKRAAGGVSERRGYLAAAMWIGGFLLAIYLLGFVVAIALFVPAYMKMHGTGWGQSIVYAVLATAAIYGIFQYVMKVDLYPGLVLGAFA